MPTHAEDEWPRGSLSRESSLIRPALLRCILAGESLRSFPFQPCIRCRAHPRITCLRWLVLHSPVIHPYSSAGIPPAMIEADDAPATRRKRDQACDAGTPLGHQVAPGHVRLASRSAAFRSRAFSAFLAPPVSACGIELSCQRDTTTSNSATGRNGTVRASSHSSSSTPTSSVCTTARATSAAHSFLEPHDLCTLGVLDRNAEEHSHVRRRP